MLINLQCLKCQFTDLVFVSKITDRPPCSKCGGSVIRKALPPSFQVRETVDNGLMSKRVERLANSEELTRKRQSKLAIE